MSDSPQLKAIKGRYKVSLKAKADFLDAWLSSAQEGLIELAELAEWLHKLAGSAGMYGYEEVSNDARQLMLDAERYTTIDSRSEEERSEISNLLRRVRALSAHLRGLAV